MMKLEGKKYYYKIVKNFFNNIFYKLCFSIIIKIDLKKPRSGCEEAQYISRDEQHDW